LMRTFRRWSGLGLHPSWTFDRQFFFFTTYTVNYSRSHCVLCSRIKEFVLSFTTSLSGRGGRNASVQIKWGRKPKMIVSCVYACMYKLLLSFMSVLFLQSWRFVMAWIQISQSSKLWRRASLLV
jgi:hypothetical protein